jgi:hypothetical protein
LLYDACDSGRNEVTNLPVRNRMREATAVMWIATFWLIGAAMAYPGRTEAEAPPAPPLDGSAEVSRVKLECWRLARTSHTPYESYAECSRIIVGTELRAALGDGDFVALYLAQRTGLYRSVDTGSITLEEALQVMKATVATRFRRGTA